MNATEGLQKIIIKREKPVMYRIIVLVTVILYTVYWVTVILHIARIVTITNRKIKLYRLAIPFYYWIAPVNEKNK